ncbi:TIGR02234 family membrane protein [Rhodococcus sp. NPDC058514]|uniref:TIGR02234 family membrane protein n=1 Tax=unclassified Rhodococcus (in: high G+C Gram-positive bacteria) TaxID=192944 RepID=UPI00366379EF
MTEQEPDRDPSAAPTRGRASAAVLPVLLLAVAALCLWASSRMTWVRVESFDGLGGARTSDLIGGTWAAATTPLALTLVAAIAASFAVRGWALRVVGLLVALVAVAAIVPAASLLIGGVDDDKAGRLAELPDRAEVTATQTFAVPAILVVLGGVTALIAAVALIRKAAVSTGLSSKYAAPAARRAEAGNRAATSEEPLSDRMLWDALDAGEDPTAGDVAGPNPEDGPESAGGTDTRR